MSVCAAALAAGCGSEDKGRPLPRAQAAELKARLAEVERRFDAGGGACRDIEGDSAPAAQRIIDGLPANVDPDLRDAVRQSFDRLFELTSQQCDEGRGQETAPETTPPETTPPPTETTPTETAPTEPETTPTQPKKKPPGQAKPKGGQGGSTRPDQGGTEAPE